MSTDPALSTKDGAMRIASIGHAALAVSMIAVGIRGLCKGDFAPVVEIVPARGGLVYPCAIILLGSGLGLLWQRTAAHAARVLLAWFLSWLLCKNLPAALPAPTSVGSWYGCAETAVMVAGAWVLYAWFAGDWDRRRIAFATGDRGVRIARVLYGLALIFFGTGHFAYPEPTAAVIPAWIPGHVFWAYFTAVTFVGAGLALIIGMWARLAAVLSVLQIGLFVPLIWLPLLVTGRINAFQRGEFVVTCILTTAAWAVADSYRRMPWFAVNQR